MTRQRPSPAEPTEVELAVLAGLVESLVQARTAIGALQALETRVLAAAVALAGEQASRGSADTAAADIPLRSIAAEIATALRVSDRTMQRQLSDASAIADRFPATLTALGEGRISRAHVTVIVEAGLSIENAAARAGYEAQAVTRAVSVTPGRLRPIVRVLAERAQSRSIDQRHAEARTRRRVLVTDLDDGMAELIAILPAALAHGIHDRLTTMAHSIRRTDAARAASADDADAGPGDPEPDDARSMDEVRADLLCDLALAGVPTAHGDGLDAITGVVQVTVPVLTLLDASTAPATLIGHGPIDLGTAKRLTANAPGWDRVLTHPITEAVLAVDRYRPTAELVRFLRVRDEHCRFPGCRMPVRRSDIDHTIDAALCGPTSDCNLAHLCRRHHVLKHASAWTVTQPRAGTLEWTSPTGRRYTDTSNRVRFSDGDPPSF